METIKQIIKNLEGEKLACEINLPQSPNDKKPTIVILHAFTGKKENQTINYLAKNLPESGYITLQFDFSGHGESEGKLEDATVSKQLDDIQSVLEQVKNINSTNLVLIGNSFSVISALAFAIINSNICGVILISGRAKYLEYIESLEKVNDMYKLFEDKFINKDFVEDYKNYDPIKNIKKLSIPILIIHGDKDETVPVNNAYLLYESSLANKKFLKIIKEADHRYSNIKFKEEILYQIKKFLVDISVTSVART